MISQTDSKWCLTWQVTATRSRQSSSSQGVATPAGTSDALDNMRSTWSTYQTRSTHSRSPSSRTYNYFLHVTRTYSDLVERERGSIRSLFAEIFCYLRKHVFEVSFLEVESSDMGTDVFIGFDSARTDNLNAPGTICAADILTGRTVFWHPRV